MTDGAVALGSQSAILPDSGISVGITCLQVRDYKSMAERVGFEPTLPFRVNTLSKRAPSATRPSLRRERAQDDSSPEGYRGAPSQLKLTPTSLSFSFYGQRRTRANRQHRRDSRRQEE